VNCNTYRLHFGLLVAAVIMQHVYVQVQHPPVERVRQQRSTRHLANNIQTLQVAAAAAAAAVVVVAASAAASAAAAVVAAAVAAAAAIPHACCRVIS
jgi:hypothetical protein